MTNAITGGEAVDFVRFVYDADRRADWGGGWFSESEEHYREHGPVFRARVVNPGGVRDGEPFHPFIDRDPAGTIYTRTPTGPGGVVMDVDRAHYRVVFEGKRDSLAGDLMRVETVTLSWDEYRRTYGDADNYVTLGAVGLRRCECCGAARVVDAVWGLDYYVGPTPAGCNPWSELPDAVGYGGVEQRGREYSRDDIGWVADYFEWRD